MTDKLKPEAVNTWFPPECQHRYAEHIIGQSGLTPTQAQHFVRLWGYGYLKRYGSECVPIKTLDRKVGSFFCSHTEAASLFYAESQGTARSAGLMIDKFVTKKLVRRESFQGSTTRISLYIPEGFDLSGHCPVDEVYADKFDPRNDTSFVALFLEDMFVFDAKRPKSMLHNLRQGLRQWAKRYPDGLRVLRHAPKNKTIAFAAIFPVHQASEISFDLPPSHSFYLNKLHLNAEDPIQFASPGDSNCHIAYIRGWQIQPDFWNYENALCLLKETQATLQRMHDDYPELSDVYTIAIHPRLEAFALNLGFETMKSDSDTSIRWLYMPLDRFLTLDGEDSLLNFDYNHWYTRDIHRRA